MSYAIAGLGQADANTSAVREASVSNGLTDPWLDADLEVQNIGIVDAPRVPREVRQALIDSGATVDSAAWDARGKVHVSWKPNATYNAVDYANIVKRVFAQAAWARLGGAPFGVNARIVMPRYRINNRLSAAQFVYPTAAPLPASAPAIARLPTTSEVTVPPPVVTVTETVLADRSRSWMMGAAAVVAIGLVGAAVYVSRAKVRKNRRRRSY
jgi:hypothetical protein